MSLGSPIGCGFGITGFGCFTGANAAASACRCIACDSGFATSMKPAPSSRTSSTAATRLATSVAVRQGLTIASRASSGASTGRLLSLCRRPVLHPGPGSPEAVVQRDPWAPAELAPDARDVEHRAADVAEPRVLQARLRVDTGNPRRSVVELGDRRRLARADVERPARPPDGCQHRLDHVVDVDEV